MRTNEGTICFRKLQRGNVMTVKHDTITTQNSGFISASIFTDLQNLLENDEGLEEQLVKVEVTAQNISDCMNTCSLSCGGACKNICTGCMNSCGTNCSGSCGNGCTGGCTSCSLTCSGKCSGCGSYCSDGCSGAP